MKVIDYFMLAHDDGIFTNEELSLLIISFQNSKHLQPYIPKSLCILEQEVDDEFNYVYNTDESRAPLCNVITNTLIFAKCNYPVAILHTKFSKYIYTNYENNRSTDDDESEDDPF